jgi:hypothetical protein
MQLYQPHHLKRRKVTWCFEDGGDLGGDTNVTMQDLESHASDLDSFETDLDFVATVSGSNGINLLECTLNGKMVAAKISFDATVTGAFYETLINMFVFHATKDIDEVSAPAIYKFGSIPREAVVAREILVAILWQRTQQMPSNLFPWSGTDAREVCVFPPRHASRKPHS